MKQIAKRILVACLFAFAFIFVFNVPTKAKAASVSYNATKGYYEIVLPVPVPSTPPTVSTTITFADGHTTTQVLQLNNFSWTKFYDGTSGSIQSCSVTYGDASSTYILQGQKPIPGGFTKEIYVALLGYFDVTISSENSTMGSVGFTTSQSVANATKEIKVNDTVTIYAKNNNGYKFAGWYKGGTLVSSNANYTLTMTPGDLTLTAKWEPCTYTVTFSANGGSVSPTTKTITYASTYGTLPTPTRAGYNFSGWYLGSTKITAASTVGTYSDHTLTASWSPKSYTVTFNADGGSVSPESKSVTYLSTYGTLPTPTRTNYTFLGWYYGEQQITSSTTVSFMASHTLYAKWRGKAVTISLNANGGSVSPTTATRYFKDTYGYLPTPTRSGYRFLGWSTTNNTNGLVTKSSPITNATPHTLYAQWGTIGPDSKTVIYDNTYATLPNSSDAVLQDPHYSFAGWHNENGISITDNTIVRTAEDHKIYGQWSPKAYTISFDCNGGTPSFSPINGAYGTVPSSEPKPTKSGYNFAGWTLSENENNTNGEGEVINFLDADSFKFAGNKTFYAKWSKAGTSTPSAGDPTPIPNPTPNSIVVSFDAAGGTPTPNSITITTGKYPTLPTVTKAGHTFQGWYYSGQKASSNGIVLTNARHTLTAVWSKNSYVVYFYDNDGTQIAPISKTVQYNEFLPAIEKPIKTGKTFLGFYTAKTGGTKYVNEDGSPATKITGTTYLYAQWANDYKITFNANGGTGTMSPIYALRSNGYISLPQSSFLRTGYRFNSWNTAADGSGKKILAGSMFTGITSDTTLYAQWDENYYTIAYDYGDGSLPSGKVNPTYVRYTETFDVIQPINNTPGMCFDGWEINSGGSITSAFGPSFSKLSANHNQTVYLTAKYVWVEDENGFFRTTFYANPLMYQLNLNPDDIRFDNWDDAYIQERDYVVGNYSVKRDSLGNHIAGSNDEFGVTFATTLPNVFAEGAIFEGWNTKPDGSGETYHEVSEIPSITVSSTEKELKLYALWSENSSLNTSASESGWTSSDVIVTSSAIAPATGVYMLLQEPSLPTLPKTRWYPAFMAGGNLYSSSMYNTVQENIVGQQSMISNIIPNAFDRNARELNVTYSLQGCYTVGSTMHSRASLTPYSFGDVGGSRLTHPNPTEDAVTVRIDKTLPTLSNFSLTQEVLEDKKDILGNQPYGSQLGESLRTTITVDVNDYHDGICTNRKDSSGIDKVILKVRDAYDSSVSQFYEMQPVNPALAERNVENTAILSCTYQISVDFYKSIAFLHSARLQYEIYVYDNAGNQTAAVMPVEELLPGESTHRSLTGEIINFCMYATLHHESDRIINGLPCFQLGEYGYLKIWTYGAVESVRLDFGEKIGAQSEYEVENGLLLDKYLLNKTILTYSPQYAPLSQYECSSEDFENSTAFKLPIYYPLVPINPDATDEEIRYYDEVHSITIVAQKGIEEQLSNEDWLKYVICDTVSNDYHYHLWPIN